MTTPEDQAATISPDLTRTIDQWQGMKPTAVCAGSEAQKLYCIQDAQADILAQAATIAELRERLREIEVGPDEMTFLEDAREAISGEDGPECLYTEEMVDRLLFAAEKDFARLKAQIKWLERNSVLKNPAQISIFDRAATAEARATAAERALVERDAQAARFYSTLEYVRQSILEYWPNSHPPTDLYRACKVAGDALAAVSVPALAAADVLSAAEALHKQHSADGPAVTDACHYVTVMADKWRAFSAAVAKWREGK